MKIRGKCLNCCWHLLISDLSLNIWTQEEGQIPFSIAKIVISINPATNIYVLPPFSKFCSEVLFLGTRKE